jgi:hypothetical protein
LLYLQGILESNVVSTWNWLYTTNLVMLVLVQTTFLVFFEAAGHLFTKGGTIMDHDNYLEGIRSAWLGEQFGQAFFNAMANASEDKHMQASWRTLAQLEYVTGNRMATLLESHDEQATTDEIIDISDELLQQYTGVSHFESMTRMQDVIEKAIIRFDHLLAVAPENDVDAVRFLVEHELALQTFVEREIAGDRENSLEAVITLLDGRT